MKKIPVFLKQQELKEWLCKVGLSQNEFAALYLLEFDGNCAEEDIKRFQENFKKQLTRKTTKSGVVDNYLNFLFTTEKFKEVGYFKPQCHTDDLLGEDVKRVMRNISKKLTDKILQDGE